MKIKNNQIRKLKEDEKYKFFLGNDLNEFIFNKYNFGSSLEKVTIFINPENFLHNDVGPAWYRKKPSGDWSWNGIIIK